MSLPAWGVWIEINTNFQAIIPPTSLPAWGVWIEIQNLSYWAKAGQSRSPHGECGLKYVKTHQKPQRIKRRSPHGECGLKFLTNESYKAAWSRSPHGECGLKLCVQLVG